MENLIIIHKTSASTCFNSKIIKQPSLKFPVSVAKCTWIFTPYTDVSSCYVVLRDGKNLDS